MSSVISGGRSSSGLGKSKLRLGIVDQRGDRLHLGQHLGARLRLLGGRGAGAVAGDIVLQPRALGILRGLRRGELRRALGALPLEGVVAARIERQLAALEVEDGVDDIVEQVALVADDDQRAGIGLEEVLEPQRRFEVEVVRRLVEQQHVGRGEQQRGERDAHLPAAREAVERLRLHRLVEAEADEDPRGARRRRCRRRSRSAARGCRRAGAGSAQCSASSSSAARSTSAASTVSNGVRGAARRFLRDIAEPGAARHLDRRPRRARAGRR